MDRKFLESFGLEKEQIDQILDQHTADIGKKINEGDTRVDAAQLKLDSLQQELDAANDTIKNLQKSNKDNESLQSQIEQYKQQIETVKQQAQQDKIDMTISMALNEAGAINAKAVMPFIDRDKISVDKNGEVIGVSDQLNAIRKDNDLSFLFKSTTTDNTPETTNVPDRGGFEPLKAENNSGKEEELSQGAIIGREFNKLREVDSKSAADYWSIIG